MSPQDHAIPASAGLLEEHWGLTGDLERLPGENINLLVRTADRRLVVKITTDPQADVGLEELALGRLEDAGMPVPRSLPALDGRCHLEVERGELRGIMRVQRFLDGTPWRDLGSTPERLASVGRMLGRLHGALGSKGDALPGSGRTHRWDLAEAGQHRPVIELHPDRVVRERLERCLHLHAACAAPWLPHCPRGLLHGDPNDENLLIDGHCVSGVLDLGDCLEGALVQDLAICLSYAFQHEGVDLDRASSLVEGYESVRRLEETETEVLFPLVLGRLATSSLIGLARRREEPGHRTWFSHEDSTLAAIERLAGLAPEPARRRLCRRPGMIGESSGVEALLEARREHLGPSLSVSYHRPLHLVRGSRQYLYSADGEPYLDLVNNVCHVGHCHPRVVEAISGQAAILNTNTRYLHENIQAFAAELAETLPEPLDTCFFVNSGSEANELALRLARAATGSSDMLVIDGAYHGSTSACVAMSPYKFDGPGGTGRPDWVHVVPSPDGYRGEIRGDADTTGDGYGLEVARVVGEACAKGRSIAGFLAEPILSCGGQIPLPRGFLAAAFEHVRKAGGLAIVDEVQVGFGRVGEAFWGFQVHDVVPDIVVMGKPIGNGHPLGAVVTSRRIAEAFDNGMEFFSTFGGNPVSCACGRAVLEVVREEGLQERARFLGGRFLEGLRALQERHELVGDVRGQGLFLGVELVRDRGTLEPADAEAEELVNRMKDRGVLLSTDGPLHNVIKIKPPMVLEPDDVDMCLRLLDGVLEDLGS